METRVFKDYYSKALKEYYPDLDQKVLKSLINHGMKTLIDILTSGKDVQLTSNTDFWAFAGKISYDQEIRDERAEKFKRKKLRSRSLQTCEKMTRYYYMPVLTSQYHDVFVNKNYNGLKMYKMVEEAKGTKCMYILKVKLKEIEKKYVLNFYYHETDNIECFLRRSKYGYKRADHTGKYLDGLP